LVIDMTRPGFDPCFRTPFDDFLFAEIGEEKNGVPLSVVSALVRLDLDPWLEAESLARLPSDTAVGRLASLIAALPGGVPAQPDPDRIAASLIGLLPRFRPDGDKPVSVASSSDVPGKKPSIIAAIYLVLAICAVGALCAAEALRPPARTDPAGAAISDSASPQVPFSSAGHARR
jgi:hypothetical protein